MTRLLSLAVLLFASVSFTQENENKDNVYVMPILFDIKNSIVKAEYGFTYVLKNNELVFEHIGKINSQTFAFEFVSQEDAKKISAKATRGSSFLEVKMPHGFFSKFEIQLINKSGKSLLSKPIDKQYIEGSEKPKNLGQVDRFIVDEIDDVIAQIRSEKEPVKLCLTQANGKMYSRLCSANFGIVERNKGFKIKYDPTQDTTLRALIENETAPLKNKVVAAVNQPIHVYFELKNGVVYEMVNQPKAIDFIEVVREDSKYKFFGSGNLPFGAQKKERQAILFLKNLFPFDSTIGDLREFYYLIIPSLETTPVIATEGTSGGVFQYFVTLSKVPEAADRVYFKRDTPNATYLDKYKLYGSSQKKLEFNSDSVKKLGNGNEFKWTTILEKKGDFNTATLEYKTEGGDENRAYFEIYRGFSQEFSLKLMGIKTEKQAVALGEVSYNKWFEGFGSQQGSLLYQRLGIGLNYFKSFNNIETGEDGEASSLESQSLAIKYRFSPGLWNWDESWGALISYQTINYQSVTTPLAGVGIFWARSMPKTFDSVLNLLPIFRYPKWVDMDFVYFPTSLDSKVKTNGSMLLNFHGKILWTKKLYGEAGFGYKSYSRETADVRTDVRLLYLTVGLGLNF